MRLDLVPGGVQVAQSAGVGAAGGFGHEERGGRAVGGQDGQQVRRAGARAVVEGQGDAGVAAGTGAQGSQSGRAEDQVAQQQRGGQRGQPQRRPGGGAVQDGPPEAAPEGAAGAGAALAGKARRNSR
ncbi:hypothetical protein GCM10017784_27570 [Deinococcus indicus]|nr:hypothetical protein GCM10017784_27570 [Deinococcus indicus]